MKLLKQFGIIVFISFIGELLHEFLPLPVPASIYGIVILFACLECKIIKVADIRETSIFLIEIMPIMFIPAAVGLMDSWEIIKPSLLSYGVITVVTTVAVMAVSGKAVQFIMHRREKK